VLSLQTVPGRAAQASREECDEDDVRFDARLFLVKDGPDRKIAFEGLKGCLDLDELQIELPEFRGVLTR
jgi:hypothetical protein